MPRLFSRFTVPPLIIAIGAAAALIDDDEDPVRTSDRSDAPALSVVSATSPAPSGLALGPAGGAPELVVVDALGAEETTPKPSRPARAPVTPPTAEAVSTVTLVASEALEFEEAKSSLPRQSRHPRGSIRIDATLDTAGGGISTVADNGGGRGGIRIGIVSGDGCRVPASGPVFDRGAGLSTRALARF